MLKGLFSSETIISLLTIFFTQPKKRFYVRELVKLSGRYPRSVSVALKKLEKSGIVNSTWTGNLKFFYLNKKSPIYPELKNMIFKTRGVGEALKKDLLKLGGVEFGFIYGSTASGQETKISDIDLMLIGQVNLDQANLLVAKLEKKLGREINLTVFKLKEWQQKKAAGSSFVKQVAAGDKIMLIGKENEL